MLRKILLTLLLPAICPVVLVGQKPLWPVAGSYPESLGEIEKFLQPTVSGEPESALFGCVRTNGYQFHEGLDIAPVQPRKRGEATDSVVAIYDGEIVHISKTAGNSS